MSKDPAFLFYSNDFLTGTYTMTDEQVGKYIRLLCLQHQKGELSEKDMLNICKRHDEDIFCKFIKENNFYYNERLREVANKRKAYSESRKKNRESKPKDKDMSNISKTYVQHMENENENVITNKNKVKTDLKDFELNDVQVGSCIEYLKITKQKIVNNEFIKSLFAVFKLKTKDKFYNNEADIYSHFLNSLKYEKIDDVKIAIKAKNDDKAKQILNSI
jgi:hypothetical protein